MLNLMHNAQLGFATEISRTKAQKNIIFEPTVWHWDVLKRM